MAVRHVTSSEFRNKQRSLFELADKGDEIIISRRGKKFSYKLTPLPKDDDDAYFTPRMLEKIDRSLQQAKEGKTIRVGNTKEELKAFLDSL
jgi:antitoxin (DNA-binding transcriptional repressor) of toxin-antitoxin stability system